MSQRPKSRPRTRPVPQTSSVSSQNRTPVIYIIVVSVVVFSLIIAALSTVDFSGLLGGDEEPTPDYAVDSIALQQTAVAADPDDYEAKALLANMLANSGRMPEAIPIYEGLLTEKPEDVTTRVDFAQALQKNDMPNDAEAQFLKVLETDPDNHTAHYYLARLYMDWQPRRQEEATEHFQRVIEIAPDSFLAEQSQGVLDTMGQATPASSPVGTP